MLYIAVIVFPAIAIALGIVSLVSVIRFVATIYRQIRAQKR